MRFIAALWWASGVQGEHPALLSVVLVVFVAMVALLFCDVLPFGAASKRAARAGRSGGCKQA